MLPNFTIVSTMQKAKIIAIPTKMEKFYGKGTMLHPSLCEIEELICLIPKNKLTTINHITSFLSKTHGTTVTCPMRTGNAIKKIANSFSLEELNNNLPFWRVVRSDKMIIKSKNFEKWASIIEEEGFKLSFTKSGNIKVHFDSDDVFSFV